MSKVKIQGNASGTGVVTLTAPNTNTDRTITLPDGTQTLIGADASGNVTVSTGNLVIGTSGKGIDFSAVSDGTRSVSSNVLDDYEEGTWTPTFTNTTTSVGSYTKIGDMVYCAAHMRCDAVGSSGVNFSGLPFTSATTRTEHRSGGVVHYHNINTTETWTVFLDTVGTSFTLRHSSLTREIAASKTIWVDFSYRVA